MNWLYLTQTRLSQDSSPTKATPPPLSAPGVPEISSSSSKESTPEMKRWQGKKKLDTCCRGILSIPNTCVPNILACHSFITRQTDYLHHLMKFHLGVNKKILNKINKSTVFCESFIGQFLCEMKNS